MFKAIKYILYLYDIGAIGDAQLAEALEIYGDKTAVNVVW
jgi:hypothetical protein